MRHDYAVLVLWLFFVLNSALASIPENVQSVLLKEKPAAKFRIDGLMTVADKLWLPITSINTENSVLSVSLKTSDEDYLLSNGWIFTQIKNNTIKGFDEYNDEIKKQILKNQIIQSFVIPKGFTLPRDLAITTGRLPIKLRNTEIASHKELIYKTRLKEEKANQTTKFLAYSNQTGVLYFANLPGSLEPVSELDLQEVKSDFEFSFLTKIKKYHGDIFLVDHNKAAVFTLKGIKIEPFISLEDLGIKGSLQDFGYLHGQDLIYLLVGGLQSRLLIVNGKNKNLIKEILVDAGTDKLLLSSYNASEADQILLLSRSKHKLTFISSLDHQIIREINLNQLDDKYFFIPYTFALSPEAIYLGVDAVNKDSKKSKSNHAQILVLDSISGLVKHSVDLEYSPFAIEISPDFKYLFSVGSLNNDAFASKLNLKDCSIEKTISLNPDIVDPKELSIVNKDLILIPGSELVGIVDIKTWDLIYKLETKIKLTLLTSLDSK